MRIETYARVGAWIMNALGIYYAWVNLGLDMAGREPREFLQALFWGIGLCICRYISTKYIFTNIGARLIASKKEKAQKVSKINKESHKSVDNFLKVKMFVFSYRLYSKMLAWRKLNHLKPNHS